MEDVGLNGNSFRFDLSFADIKPDLGMIPLMVSVKEEEKADESLSCFRGRPFRIRNPASVLKLRRDLENFKQQKESSSADVKASTSGGHASLSLHAKVDTLSKNLDEFRKQWIQANSIASGYQWSWSMPTEIVTTPRLQHSSQETVVSMEAASEEPGGGPSVNNTVADEHNSSCKGRNNSERQHEHEDANSFSTSKNSQLYPLVPNHIDITVLPGKPAWYRCNICQKRFIMKAQIMNHDNCQKGENLFKCEQCGRGFVTKSHYEYHLKMHERQAKGNIGTRDPVGNKGMYIIFCQFLSRHDITFVGALLNDSHICCFAQVLVIFFQQDFNDQPNHRHF
ncbi:unnamed protein product [Orchesella dallaii]|uniref:C2H2-type domain-containing protein n=1 Tax=Orchesella dallaii TaxID=48710 RepID=A0ABP1RS34_9HEXA